MNACTAGPMPEISHDVDPSKEDAPDTTPESLSIEEGDRIFATGLFPPGPRSESFQSAPLCSNDGIVTSNNRLHIETSQSAHSCCDNVITSDNRPCIKISQSAIMMVSSQVTMGRASKSLNPRTFAMMMCLLHLKVDRVPKTFDPRTLTLIPQWTLEHYPPSPNV